LRVKPSNRPSTRRLYGAKKNCSIVLVTCQALLIRYGL
jgi:hypothetical protein